MTTRVFDLLDRKIAITSITSHVDSSLFHRILMVPTMHRNQFGVLVKCLKANNVRLIERTEDGKTGREFVHFILEPAKENCTVILAGSNFMSILSDGSLARKPGQEIELVLVRCQRNAIPTYIILSLLEMENFEGVNADSIVKE